MLFELQEKALNGDICNVTSNVEPDDLGHQNVLAHNQDIYHSVWVLGYFIQLKKLFKYIVYLTNLFLPCYWPLSRKPVSSKIQYGCHNSSVGIIIDPTLTCTCG